MFLCLAILGAVAVMPIRGGTPFERKTVKAALAGVPACLRDIEDVPVTIRIVPSDENNAYFDFEKETVEINEAAIPGTSVYEAALKDDAAYACTSVRRMRRFGNLDATLLHEFVHHFHFDGESIVPGTNRYEANDGLVSRFLAIKFRKARARVRRDSSVRALERRLNTLDGVETWTDEQQNRFCDLQEALDRRIAAFGFPVRYPGDGPYTVDDATGGEYFAEAIETLAWYPDVFCRAYEPAERSWLIENLGACLSKTVRIPSCAADPKPNASRRLRRPR